MKKIVIIEDEAPARAALLASLKEAAPEASVQAILSSVKEGLQYFSAHSDADLILSDVQLSDGASFSIFQQVPVTAPIVFITGYNQFMLNAFAYNSIDYLLKPVTTDDLHKALQKYERLQEHFAAQSASLTRFLSSFHTKKKVRLLVKKGVEYITLLCEDIVLFYTENKLVYVIDKMGKKYLCDKNLSELESELDTQIFFRVNRQYIININYIRSFKSYERVKLQIELIPSDLPHVVIVSQETAPLFRKWVAGE